MNSSTGDKALAALGGVALLAIAVPAAITLNGWALSILWRWFAVATFHLPALAIPQAIGVTLIVAYLTHQSTPHDEERGWQSAIGSIIVKPLASLAFGWIVTQFM